MNVKVDESLVTGSGWVVTRNEKPATSNSLWSLGRSVVGSHLKVCTWGKDCKCKCIVTTNIRSSYLLQELVLGGRREVEKSRERQRERERKREEAVHKRSYEASF